MYDDLIGIPYGRGERGPHAYDCAGLVVEVLRRRGVSMHIPETPGSDVRALIAMRQILGAEWIEAPTPCVGAVVFLKPDHVGVMLDRRRFIHASGDLGSVCIERIDNPMWRNRVGGFYEYAGAR